MGKLPNMSIASMPGALGFGCFFAWQHALVSLLFPPSFGLAFSPLVAQSLAGCLVSAVALVSFVKNRGTFSARGLHAVAACSVALGSAAAILVAADVAGGAPWSYVCAAVIGCAIAVMFYGWADVIAGIARELRAGTALLGIAVSSVLSYLFGCLTSVPMLAGVAVLGAFALAGFALANARLRQPPGPDPLVFRPAHAHHFRLLFLAIMLYALVFGSVSGTTAEQASAATTRSFNMDMAPAMLAVSAVLVLALAVVRRPVRLSSMGRVLTPVLALLFLLHILLGGSGNGWLPVLTLGFWQLVQVFVLLLLVELAQSGYASLSFVFPLGWSFISLGFTVGALFGQVAGRAFGNDEGAVQSITVVLVIVAVIASSILAAAQYPQVSGAGGLADGGADGPGERFGSGGHVGGLDGDGRASGGTADGLEALAGRPASDPIAAACAGFATRYGLSGREREVLELLARGNTRASIAEKLCISENTVRVHVKNIYAKLHIHSKQQLIDMVDRRA